MSTITGRYIFYNGSSYDVSDDWDAVDTGKTALLPGETVTVANYTSYTFGINGLFIDFDSLPGTLSSADDFAFYVSTDGTTWTPVTDPTVSQSGTRVKLIWANSTIVNKWMRVTVKATSNTGLTSPDVHYWGNLKGDTGASPGVVDAIAPGTADYTEFTSHYYKAVGIAIMSDFNKDGFVDNADLFIWQNSVGTTLALFDAPYHVKVSFQSGPPTKILFTQ